MKLRPVFVACLVAACAKPPAPVVAPLPVRATNALTPAATITRAIAEPRIRVGMLSDQTSVTFPRIEGGYYLITDSTASILRRGFTDSAPLPESAPHYALQAP